VPAALQLGYTSSKNKAKFMYLLGADEVSDIPKDAFVVYQGHHGDTGAHYADVILPGAAYTEKSGTYVNTEGRVQVTRAAVAPPGAAREDWKILRALSDVMGQPLPYDDLAGVRERLADVSPSFVSYDVLAPASPPALPHSTAAVGAEKFGLPIRDFYMTDPISRASSTMAKCSAAFTHGKKVRAKKRLGG